MTRRRRDPSRDPNAPRRDRRRVIPEEPGSGSRYWSTRPGPGEPGYVDPARTDARNTQIAAAEKRFMAVVTSDASDEQRRAAWAAYRRERGDVRVVPMPSEYLRDGPYHQDWLALERERQAEANLYEWHIDGANTHGDRRLASVGVAWEDEELAIGPDDVFYGSARECAAYLRSKGFAELETEDEGLREAWAAATA